MKPSTSALVVALALAGCDATRRGDASVVPAAKTPDDPSEPHLANVRQLTFGG